MSLRKIKLLIEKLNYTKTCVDLCRTESDKKYFNTIDNGVEISKAEFLKNCDVDDAILKDMKKYPNDYQYGKSEDDKIYYYQHSRIEHFYE